MKRAIFTVVAVSLLSLKLAQVASAVVVWGTIDSQPVSTYDDPIGLDT